jgi:hypothetical protein
MFTIYTDETKFKFCSELIILGGLLDTIPEKDALRMNNLIEYCNKYITYTTNIEDADIIVLPYKLHSDVDPYLFELCELGKSHNKPVLAFYIDDNPKKFRLPSNCIVYRTAFSTKDRLANEEPIMALIDDVFCDTYIDSPELSIGFCGQVNCNRKTYLSYLLRCQIKTDFILRPITYFSSNFRQNKQLARKEYFTNIEKNLFTFCYRGYGNYSYRLYEVLMMGRIPVLVNTDCVIPFLEEAQTDGLGIVIVNEEDFNNDNSVLERSIREFYDTHRENIRTIQVNNRRIYERYYSYYGFIGNLIKKYRNK